MPAGTPPAARQAGRGRGGTRKRQATCLGAGTDASRPCWSIARDGRRLIISPLRRRQQELACLHPKRAAKLPLTGRQGNGNGYSRQVTRAGQSAIATAQRWTPEDPGWRGWANPWGAPSASRALCSEACLPPPIARTLEFASDYQEPARGQGMLRGCPPGPEDERNRSRRAEHARTVATLLSDVLTWM